MLGSLNDFIEVPRENLQFQINPDLNQDDHPQPPLAKYSRVNALQIRKKRTMSGVENYKAGDKSLLFQKFAKNFPQLQKTRRKLSAPKQQNPLNNRKPMSQSRLSSLFYGQNPSRMNQNISKDQYGGLYFKTSSQEANTQLKRQHNLLRAIVRTKLNQEQKITNTYYEQSFNRMSAGFKNIKSKPIPENHVHQIQEEPKSNRSIQLPIQKRSKSKLTHKERLEFQSCLNWSKKRNKNGLFYAQKLGKSNLKVEVDSNSNVQNRKSILQFIHSRSNSLDIGTIS